MHENGWNDGDIVEIIVHVALTTLFNYLNRVAETEADFPAPPGISAAGPEESPPAAAPNTGREDRR
jgi:hypothetical protein